MELFAKIVDAVKSLAIYFLRKHYIVYVRLGSKHASGRYWLEKLITDFTLETSGKKIVTVFRGVFKIQWNVYYGASLGK